MVIWWSTLLVISLLLSIVLIVRTGPDRPLPVHAHFNADRNRSERTLKLLEQRQNELEHIKKGSKEWMTVTRRYRNEIAHSCREDYREYVELFFNPLLPEVICPSKFRVRVSHLLK